MRIQREQFAVHWINMAQSNGGEHIHAGTGAVHVAGQVASATTAPAHQNGTKSRTTLGKTVLIDNYDSFTYNIVEVKLVYLASRRCTDQFLLWPCSIFPSLEPI